MLDQHKELCESFRKSSKASQLPSQRSSILHVSLKTARYRSNFVLDCELVEKILCWLHATKSSNSLCVGYTASIQYF